MDRLCVRTFLLMFTVGVVIKSSTQDTEVEPTVPATVEASLGSPAAINCTFQINATHLIMNWFFSQTSCNGSKKIEIHDERYNLERGDTWSSLTIKKVVSDDSGWYFCEVIQESPTLKHYLSNGSHLIILNFNSPLSIKPTRVIVKSATQDTDQPLIPATVEACSGSSATINCTFQINASYSIVNWYFSETPDHSSESKKIEIHDERYHQEKRETWSSLTIKEVLSNVSGWYFCQVIQHIPQLRQYHSNGSHLIIIEVYQDRYSTDACVPSESFCTVSESPSSVTPTWLIWTGSVLGCAVLAIAMAIIWSTRRRAP
ncbi:uncharacterized protein LOC119265263 isoform X2 [Pygocentrus nattereri]|uniref:uncharacterized protein LOC119265263 isoform X2 n=1 Tax=Pygocentrus nattereri TaxID=42514 RepID=UPI0018915D99|nr:uncharacterized protein LOC119265263 isoform X2 [Pygocentrus nattereri]